MCEKVVESREVTVLSGRDFHGTLSTARRALSSIRLHEMYFSGGWEYFKSEKWEPTEQKWLAQVAPKTVNFTFFLLWKWVFPKREISRQLKTSTFRCDGMFSTITLRGSRRCSWWLHQLLCRYSGCQCCATYVLHYSFLGYHTKWKDMVSAALGESAIETFINADHDVYNNIRLKAFLSVSSFQISF